MSQTIGEPEAIKQGKAVAVALPLLMVCAFLTRSIGYELAFLDDGAFVYGSPDAFYHARRAFYTFSNFPSFLIRDPCINYPDGAVITHPPLYDWLIAAITRSFGSDVATFHRVTAWIPVFLGTLTLIPIQRLGRRIGGTGVGLGAAAIYAFMPIAISYARVGEIDHHAAAGLIGAILLALFVALLDADASTRATVRSFVALSLARGAILLVWSGSLLYLVPGEVALVIVAVLRNQRQLLIGQTLSCLATVLFVLPFVLMIGEPAGGHYSTTELSRFHLLAYAAGALLCSGWLLLQRSLDLASSRARLLGLLALIAAIAGASLLLPGLRDAIGSGLSFLGKSDGYTETVLEQLPLFHEQGAITRHAGERRMGYYAYLVSLVPLVYLRRPRRPGLRAAHLLLFAWSMLFGYLAIEQVRYAHDYAAAGCVGFALILAWLRELAIERWGNERAATIAVCALGIFLFAPAIRLQLIPTVNETLQHRFGPASDVDRALYTIDGTQLRFAQRVARATPDSGCAEAKAPPPYGILAHPSLGHVLHYVAQRATPADPFGPYIGRENFDAVGRFITTDSEETAIAIANRLGTPYVATAYLGQIEDPIWIWSQYVTVSRPARASYSLRR
jgi:asparagine N-glycosylation enzyme membrane subunit Stt3